MIHVSAAEPRDLPAVLQLLRRTMLTAEGVPEHFNSFAVAKAQGSVVGCAGLELYGDSSLLRSVAVDREFQSRGLGARLIRYCLEAAKRDGVETVFLLTESADSYFARFFDFRILDRSKVPSSVRQSVQFLHACPDTATVMALPLDDLDDRPRWGGIPNPRRAHHRFDPPGNGGLSVEDRSPSALSEFQKEPPMTSETPRYFIDPDDAPAFMQMAGLETRVLTGLRGEKMMMVLNSTLPGQSVPRHSHPHEQIGMVHSGEAELTIGNETRVVKKGDFYCIPADVPHADTCLGDEPFVMLDIFYPVREDFIEKIDDPSVHGPSS